MYSILEIITWKRKGRESFLFLSNFLELIMLHNVDVPGCVKGKEIPEHLIINLINA
jgi:hypothetical protein